MNTPAANEQRLKAFLSSQWEDERDAPALLWYEQHNQQNNNHAIVVKEPPTFEEAGSRCGEKPSFCATLLKLRYIKSGVRSWRERVPEEYREGVEKE